MKQQTKFAWLSFRVFGAIPRMQRDVWKKKIVKQTLANDKLNFDRNWFAVECALQQKKLNCIAYVCIYIATLQKFACIFRMYKWIKMLLDENAQ